jgi:uncharacterized membrane protein YqiK
MSGMLQRFGEIVRKWFARSIETPGQYARSALAATLTVAQTLLELNKQTLIPDIKRIKEANIQQIEAKASKRKAEAEEKHAEAQKRAAEAVEAANRATLHKRRDALARAERDRQEAEAAKTRSEAEAIRMDAETRRIQAVAEAQARLLEAVSRLRQEGGEFFVSKENLEQLLQIDQPQIEREVVDE